MIGSGYVSRSLAARPLRLAGEGFAYFYMTSLVAAAAVVFGATHLPASGHGDPFDPPGRVGPEAAFANWDGKWYARIARDGYSHALPERNGVAFFPAFPLAGRAVSLVTGLPPGPALVMASNLFLWGAIALLLDYTRRRFPHGPPDLAGYVALALALSPLSFFCRVAYTESMFLFLTVLAMYGFQRAWPLAVVALVIGVATATRATGIALIPVLVLYVWQVRPAWRSRLVTLVWAVPASCWGLGAYAAYLGYEFGDPLAFSAAQEGWRFRPRVPLAENLAAVATLEPVRAAYDPTSPGYWGRFDPYLDPPFSLAWANPAYFGLALGALVIGAWRRWLTAAEVLLALGLVLIPYLTRGYYACMLAHGRYVAAAFPLYLVAGHVLARLGPTVAAAVLAISGCLMAAYAALFAARYFLI